ncbi:hypothetical protein EYR40_006740 [Pleurotus pulmonarius]|nr:hypothetical protein EYR36_011361 [Pleurotus pulmonarius]KAF4599641.1 hypothetical protein EYR40_006740 [Pleurotus pulmonarius]
MRHRRDEWQAWIPIPSSSTFLSMSVEVTSDWQDRVPPSLLITSEDLVQRSGTFRLASLLTIVCTPRVDYWGTKVENDNETLGIHGFKWQAVSGEKLVRHATTISELLGDSNDITEVDSWSGKQESAKDYPSGVRSHQGGSVLSLDSIALARRKAG